MSKAAEQNKKIDLDFLHGKFLLFNSFDDGLQFLYVKKAGVRYSLSLFAYDTYNVSKNENTIWYFSLEELQELKSQGSTIETSIDNENQEWYKIVP